jgi:hypothetical protein
MSVIAIYQQLSLPLRPLQTFKMGVGTTMENSVNGVLSFWPVLLASHFFKATLGRGCYGVGRLLLHRQRDGRGRGLNRVAPGFCEPGGNRVRICPRRHRLAVSSTAGAHSRCASQSERRE